MELKLKVMAGKSVGQLLPVPGPRFVIGRGDKCQLRPRSDAVAEQQCAIEFEPARVCVRDLADNGETLINGASVSGLQELKSGDRLKVGPLEFEIQLSTSLASRKAPKVQGAGEAASRLAAGRKKELDVSAWLDDPAEELVESAAPARSVQMSDEERAALGLITPEEQKAIDAKKAAERPVMREQQPDTQQVAADVLHKYFKKK